MDAEVDLGKRSDKYEHHREARQGDRESQRTQEFEDWQ